MDMLRATLARINAPVLSAACVALSFGPAALAQQPAPGSKPNRVLVIMSDDIGHWNIGAYNPRHDGLSHAQRQRSHR